MENVNTEGNEDQYVTSPSGEALARNVHMRYYGRISKSTQWHDPGFEDIREWKSDAVVSLSILSVMGVIISM